jgi:hypothetical protein
MRVGLIAWAAMIPGLQCYLFRRKYPDLWKNHMEGPSSFPILLGPWIDAGWVEINYSNNVITFWNGSKIFLCHAQHEHSVYDYLGAEIHVLCIDELTTFTEKMYRFLRSRVRLTGLELPEEYRERFPRILTSSNPGNIGHGWVKASFVDLAQEGAVTQMDEEEGGMLRQYIRAVLEDNPSLNTEAYEGKLKGLGNKELVKAMRHGDWNIVAGGFFDDVFGEWNVIQKPWVPPSHWECYTSFDWGSASPFSVGFWTVSDGTEAPDGRYYARGALIRFAEWYGASKKTEETNVGLRLQNKDIGRGIMERMARFEAQGVNFMTGPADPSIWKEDGGPSIYSQIMQGTGGRDLWEKADNSRVSGWQTMRDMLEPEGDRGPKLLVMANCLDWLRTVPVAIRDERNWDDINTDTEDHILDDTRYACTWRRNVSEILKLTGM